MTPNSPENQPPVEQIAPSTAQSGQEPSLKPREDDPDNATTVQAVAPLSDFKSQPLYWL